jgi:hypothetical protein
LKGWGTVAAAAAHRWRLLRRRGLLLSQLLLLVS